MLSLYRCLLYLYPAVYRHEYGEEMAGVFTELLKTELQKEVRSEERGKGLLPRGRFFLREFAGLLSGAVQEHSRAIAGSNLFPPRRFTMRSEFRFPKATPVLMTIILAGVILTIEKATAIEQSLPLDYPQQLPPIQPEHFTFFPAMAVIFLSAYAAALIGWIVLFALRRSGVHRLSEMPAAQRK
jgi:hypothetical protein